MNRRAFLAGLVAALLPHTRRAPLPYAEWLNQTVLADWDEILRGNYDERTLWTPYPERYRWYLTA